MSIQTTIEWCDSTANPAMGCDGCELWNGTERRCYAGALTHRYGGHSKGYPASFSQPVIFPERIGQMIRWSDLTGQPRPLKPWLDGYPRTIFLGDMGDNFTESLALDWLSPYVPAMAASPHIYILLTKRPARMARFWLQWLLSPAGRQIGRGAIPANFWLLTSVTSQANAGRIDELIRLRQLRPAVLGVSFEPAWSALDLRPYLTDPAGPALQWIIAGGETGAAAKPYNPVWFRDVRDLCHKTGAAFFFKHSGEWSPTAPPTFHKISSKTYSHQTHAYGKNGLDYNPVRPDPDDFPQMVYRVGKDAAGAELDGREWRGMPANPRELEAARRGVRERAAKSLLIGDPQA